MCCRPICIIQVTQLATVQHISAIDKLTCIMCNNILHRPVQLPCQIVVCAKCLAQKVAHNESRECPCMCCHSVLTVEGVKPAPSIYISLLHCGSCKSDIRAGLYTSHNCSTTLGSVAPTTEPSATCMLPSQSCDASTLDLSVSTIQRAVSSSPESGIIKVSTGGRVC